MGQSVRTKIRTAIFPWDALMGSTDLPSMLRPDGAEAKETQARERKTAPKRTGRKRIRAKQLFAENMAKTFSCAGSCTSGFYFTLFGNNDGAATQTRGLELFPGTKRGHS